MDFKKLKRRPAPPRESVVVLFGSPKDPEVMNSINKIAIGRRRVEVIPRPTFETGLGRCGKHLCSCKHGCMQQYANPQP